MLSKSQQRDEIIKFFTQYKLSSSCYYKSFYKRKGHPEVYDFIINWYEPCSPLYDKSLAQKIYHIFKDDYNIPVGVKFINFVEGYQKGGRRVKNDPRYVTDVPRTLEWFCENLDNINNTGEYYSYEEFISIFYPLYKTLNYKKILKDQKLINYILKFKSDNNISSYMAVIALFYKEHDLKCPYCNNLRKIYERKFIKTCDNKQCKSKLLSDTAIKRGVGELHSEKARLKKAETIKNNPRVLSEETKRKLSESNKKTWTKEFSEQIKQQHIKNGVYKRHSEIMKKIILEGKFTPKTTNRLTHKRLFSDITGIKSYRSGWEKQFHEKYPHLLYETLRIKYNFNGVEHIYIVDFIDHDNKIVYEIKPASMKNDDKVVAKHLALIEWCNVNNYTYNIITEHEFDFI